MGDSHKPKKAKHNVITKESKKYQKVWVLLQKSSVSTNKCGAQTCFIIEKADGPNAGGTAVRKGCGKQSIHSDRGPPFVPIQLGDRVWGWNPQSSNRTHHCCLSEAHRQTNSQEQVVLGFRGECCLSTSSSLLCLSSAVSLIALGMKPLQPRPKIPNAHRYWGDGWLKHNIYIAVNTKEPGSDLHRNHNVSTSLHSNMRSHTSGSASYLFNMYQTFAVALDYSALFLVSKSSLKIHSLPDWS